MDNKGCLRNRVRADFNSPLVLNYSYIFRLFVQSNGYRSIDGSTAKFYEYETPLTAGKLLLANSIYQWNMNYTPLTMAKNAYSLPWGKSLSHSYNSLYDNKTSGTFC